MHARVQTVLMAIMLGAAAGVAAHPTPARAQYYGATDNTTRTRGGMARFTDNCSGNTFVIIRVAGSPADLIRFELKNAHTVHFDVPPGSTYALQCGGYAGNYANYSYLTVE
ncbi:MAG TPA: hypothetical protein VGM36_09205 [Rhizomicrobium sp.]